MEEIWKPSVYVNLLLLSIGLKFNTRETCHDRDLQYIDISSYRGINKVKTTILYIWDIQTETVIPKYQ